jgi:hypothetical protein
MIQPDSCNTRIRHGEITVRPINPNWVLYHVYNFVVIPKFQKQKK